MPVTKAAAKALRQNRAARRRNTTIKNQLKKLRLRLGKAYAAKNLDEAKTVTAQLSIALDRAAQKKVIHRNTAARKKSRLAQRWQAAAKRPA